MVDHSPMIYLDNAATTFPKPLPVLEEMFNTYARLGVSPGRGSYDLAAQCEQYVHEVRRRISDFFGGDSPGSSGFRVQRHRCSQHHYSRSDRTGMPRSELATGA